MKNLIIIVADSLRRDTFREITGIESMKVKSRNSTTALSLPWMLSGMEVFSPTMSIPSDLSKIGYTTYLVHSNEIVERFKQPFDYTINLSTGNRREQLARRYNRLRSIAQTWLPHSVYRYLKNTLRGAPETYIPYARIEKNLQTIDKLNPTTPYFLWLHIMDTHAPYYPRDTALTREMIIDANDNQISAVRGYYHPTIDEALHWKNLYTRESHEMWVSLKTYIDSLDLDETVVVFTSDHGEEFGEHGEYGHKGNRFNPENVDVPFYIVGENLPKVTIKDHSTLRREILRLIH